MTHFLVVFDRRKGEAISLTPYPRGADAMKQRIVQERAHAGEDIEVVVLVADHESELERTHTRYFRGAGELLQGIASAS